MVGYLRLSATLRLIVLLVAYAGLSFSTAQAAEPTAPLTVCVRQVQEGDTAATVFAAGGFNCVEQQTKLGAGDYWARIQHVNKAPHQGESLVFRHVSMWQDSTSVFIRYVDGHIEQQDYSAANAAPFLTIGAIFEIPIPWRKDAVRDILVKVNNSANIRGILLGPEITTERASAAKKGNWIALYACFAGLGLTLLVYNLALWRALRHRFQLFYCAMVASMLAYTFAASGSLLFLFPAISNITRLKCGYFFLALTAATTLLFVRDFFEPRVVTRRVGQVALLSACVPMAAASLLAFFSANNVIFFGRLYYAGLVPCILAISLIILSAVRHKSDYLGIFLVAWAAPLATAVGRWLHGMDYLPYNFWLDNSSILGFGVEALVSSTAISMRIRTLTRERDQARHDESAAIQLARIDPLTGLLNRRGVMDAVLGRPDCQQLILLDIDHFKRINDTYGHDRGDDVLQYFALALKKWAPDEALVSRVGGEEFAIIVSRGTVTRGQIDSLLRMIRSAQMPGNIAVTASMGVAEGPLSSDQNWQSLYREADAALYRAKSDGRNRFCIATPLARVA
jgi:diguanylate cyclase (GGDEF)-like protein